MTDELIICLSPRNTGRSAYLARALEAKKAAEGVFVKTFFLGNHPVDPCEACDACKEDYTCIIDDGMQTLYPLMDAASRISIISPVYFSGPPAQVKAVLDRMQPYYWKQVKEGVWEKRDADLFVIGGGGDPHGFEPLIGCMRSALAVAGFTLAGIHNCVQMNEAQLDEVASDPDQFLYQS